MRTGRAEWAERVERWRRSGLTARKFAASIGVKPATLTYWAWRLGRGRGKSASAPVPVDRTAFVEVVTDGTGDDRFELELGNGRRLHSPARFEAAALQRLLAMLAAGR